MRTYLAQKPDDIAYRLEPDCRHRAHIFEHPHATDSRRRQDRASATRRLTFIVKRDIAGHDWVVERTARVRHAFQTTHNLRHDFRPLRVGEVKAIGNGKRGGTNGANVAIGFGYRLLAALIRVGVAISGRAIRAHCKSAVGAVNADDRRVTAGKLRGISANLTIILLPYPGA